MLKFVDELPLDGDANGFSGWGRLDLHARRVRTLYMEPLHIRIPPNIYFRIHAMRDSPLLPGLKKIYIPNNPPQVHPGFSYIPSPNLNNPSVDLSSALFLASGSTLDTVQIDSNAISDREFFVPFLSLLYIKSPGLSHLALRGVALSASVEHIYRFTELQSLEIRLPFPPLHQLLHKLGELPHLLDLIIDTDDFAPSIQPHTTPISISNSKFTQLRHLQILGTTGSIRCILNVLKGLTNLSALKIDRESDTVTPWGFQVQVQDISEIWKPFFEVISTFSEDIWNLNCAARKTRHQNAAANSAHCILFNFFLPRLIYDQFTTSLRLFSLNKSPAWHVLCSNILFTSHFFARLTLLQ